MGEGQCRRREQEDGKEESWLHHWLYDFGRELFHLLAPGDSHRKWKCYWHLPVMRIKRVNI